jgi:tetratricopeptide (TPR) repeat protein
MSTSLAVPSLRLDGFALKALKASAGFWFVVALIGQLMFAFTVAAFYGGAAGRGDFEAWNRRMTHGYVAGDHVGNVATAIHLLAAAIIMVSGALQLIPLVRARAPAFHRWNGRVYFVTAFSVSLAGLYMMWVRGTVGDLSQHIGTSLLAVLIMLFAVMALRHALARDFVTHRRWALRLFVAVTAALTIRAGFVLWTMIFKGPYGYDPVTLSGPLPSFLAFGQYLVPLAVLELYLRVREGGGPALRMSVAAGLFVLTLVSAAGIAGTAVVLWLPTIKVALINRTSIAEPLEATIASAGIDSAVRQYHDLKATRRGNYDFSEFELNRLGYKLITAKQYKAAIQIFQLNVEAFPQSGNTYDSLAEGYMDNGDRALSIANYHRSLQLDPANGNAVVMLKKLGAS